VDDLAQYLTWLPAHGDGQCHHGVAVRGLRPMGARYQLRALDRLNRLRHDPARVDEPRQGCCPQLNIDKEYRSTYSRD
jgi:hypothetical protein